MASQARSELNLDRPLGPPPFEAAAQEASAQLRAIPDSSPVRLRKKTSNLFRARTETTADLDLSAFNGVYNVDAAAQTATVGGLTTYEDLVAATLPHGLVPLCVPQLRTITLGGAVTGMGIEAACFRNGMPHESVLAMDILTGDGQVLRVEPEGEYADLFAGFPNSYGSLGYALRIEIELEPVARYVSLRHLPCESAETATELIAQIADAGEWQGQKVDYLDGTVFGPDEIYLTVGRYTDEASQTPSDYAGQDIYYRSLQQRRTDLLTTNDFIWRWDTDWFWCSRVFGAQNRLIRHVWPRRWLRSNVYWKIVAFDRKHHVAAKIDRVRRNPAREPVIQDIEVPLAKLPEFLEFFHREVGIEPAWICPLQQRRTESHWPLYELDPDTVYVNVGFWSSVPLPSGVDPEAGVVNRAIEAEVTRLNGRKSLYSTSFYERDEFYEIYGHGAYHDLKATYDPQSRLTGMYEKCVSGQ